jgi:carotenoid cleavage dioxygenase-like enzyme
MTMSDHLASEPVRPARRVYPRRIHRVAPDRLPKTDMRTRRGRQYLEAYRAACVEFPGAPADRVAQIVRLRLLAEQQEGAALAGSGSTDAAIRCANVAARASRDLHVTANGKPESAGASALHRYLAEIAEAADDVAENAAP